MTSRYRADMMVESTIVETSAYASALRSFLLGGPLDVEQIETLELGRAEAGFPHGRYPLPTTFCDAIDDVAVGVVVEPVNGTEPIARRRDRLGASVADLVADTGYRCARAVHTFPTV